MGRRTFVYTATAEETELKAKDLVVKMSYQVSTGRSEQAPLRIARKSLVDHLPELYLAGDICQLSDGIRGIFSNHGVSVPRRIGGPDSAWASVQAVPTPPGIVRCFVEIPG